MVPSPNSSSIVQMCYLQHVQLHSRTGNKLNQELWSHYAGGQRPPSLTGERHSPKISNLAAEQLNEFKPHQLALQPEPLGCA